MKKNLLISLALVMLLAQCRRRNNDPTPAELLAREWRVARALINGQVDNQGNYANFRLRFTAGATTDGGSYTVTPGGAPRPNLTPGNTGTWLLNDTNNPIRLTLDRGTPSEVALAIVVPITASQLQLRWRVPRTQDKTEPEITYELVPVE
ncbi:MAG: hypothetical protein MUC97_02135 [Bernardetiaceae bacterium]|jgi:hypothetical protein|nr:hypothetical protein [Bernardetiaceae bacterium]